MIEWIEPDPDVNGPLTSAVTTFDYDAAGQLRFLTDGSGNTTTYRVDALDRLSCDTI